MVLQTLSGVLIIAIWTQLLKSFYEAFGLSPTSPLHDPLVWLTAFTAGIGGYVGVALIQGPSLTGPVVLTAMGQGLLASFSAVGTYSLVTHPYFANTSTITTLLQRVSVPPFPAPPPARAPGAIPLPPLLTSTHVSGSGPGLTLVEPDEKGAVVLPEASGPGLVP